MSRGDAEKCAASLQDLLQSRSDHGQADDLYRAFHLLLPSSPLVSFLQPLPPPADGYIPLVTPSYPPTTSSLPQIPSTLPHALHLLASLPLLITLLIRQESLVKTAIEAQVKAGRSRLGGGTEKDVRRRVEGEVLGGELGLEMVDLLREVGSHPAVDDNVRREVEVREFDFWRKLVSCLR